MNEVATTVASVYRMHLAVSVELQCLEGRKEEEKGGKGEEEHEEVWVSI